MLYEDKRPGGAALWALGLTATVLVHGAVVVIIWLSSSSAGGNKGVVAGPGQFIDVQAVKFGKPRDMSFLPHKAAAPIKQPKPKLALTENDKALPKPPKPDDEKDKPPEADPLELAKQRGRQLAAPDEPGATGSAEEEGDPSGVRGGTATVGKGPPFLQHMVAAVQNKWTVSNLIKDDELQKLNAQACFKMDKEGKVSDFKVVKPSGNERFDATLVEAVKSIEQFEPPPEEYLATVSNDGVCINFNMKR